jgi:hypothetical protein
MPIPSGFASRVGFVSSWPLDWTLVYFVIHRDSCFVIVLSLFVSIRVD